VIVRGAETVTVEAAAIRELIDTTGAGDLYAAGVLYGYTQGRDLKACGDLGSLAAGLVIQQIGPRPRQNLRDEAQKAGLL
jgi:sugar/nucleoside kinase (ribokinase family)